MLCAFVVAGCGNGGQSQSDPSPELVEYQQLLEKFPASNPGTGADVFVDGPTEQPETLAYVLKAEAIRGASSERSNNCIRRLIALSDLDGDGIAGWGIDQIWDAFGDDSTNPRNQVYLVSNAIVLDGLLSALAAKIIPASDLQSVRAVVHQSVVSALGSFTEDGDGGFFWYSTSASDAINVPNVNAYLVGVIQKAMHQHQDLFSETETASLGNRIDRAVKTLLDKSRTSSDGLPYWAYVDENYASPTDLLHHCYTILGLELYHSHGGRVALSYSVEQAANSILVFLKGETPTEYPQNISTLAPSLKEQPARVWAPGFAIEMLTVLGRASDSAPFLHSLKNDYGVYPELRYTPIQSIPPPTDVFYSRIVAHCLPGLARRATGNLLQ